jgi:hypothetical protein
MLTGRVGQNHIGIIIRCIHGIFGKEITKYIVVYGVDMRLWPTPYIGISRSLHIF